MNKHLFAILPLSITTVFAVDPAGAIDVNKEIDTHAKQSVGYLNQSFSTFGVQKGDLISLIQELKKLGFGDAPPSAPWHRELDEAEKAEMSEEDIKAQKLYLAEAKERVSRMGVQDFEMFRSLDSNGDFKLQAGEAEKVITSIVASKLKEQLTLDQDGDSKLTMKEYMIGVSVKGEVAEDGADWHQRSHFNHEDANKDGFVDQREIIAYQASDFTWKGAMVLLNSMLVKSDEDKNSELSESEFKAIFKENAEFGRVMKCLTFPVKHQDLWSTFYWSDPEHLLTQLK